MVVKLYLIILFRAIRRLLYEYLTISHIISHFNITFVLPSLLPPPSPGTWQPVPVVRLSSKTTESFPVGLLVTLADGERNVTVVHKAHTSYTFHT